MKEVYSRNGGTSMKNKQNISKFYNIELILLALLIFLSR